MATKKVRFISRPCYAYRGKDLGALGDINKAPVYKFAETDIIEVEQHQYNFPGTFFKGFNSIKFYHIWNIDSNANPIYDFTTIGGENTDMYISVLDVVDYEEPNGKTTVRVDKNGVTSGGSSRSLDSKNAESTKSESDTLRDQMSAIEKELYGYGEENKIPVSYTDSINNLLTNNMNGIYGIPYQFMPSVDPRMVPNRDPKNFNGADNKCEGFGRKYSEKIIANLPLLCITPGKCDYMSGYTKDEKEGLLAALLDDNGPETEISNIITKNGRYYTFTFDYNAYFDYVNGMCRSGARFLEIDDLEITVGEHTDTLKKFDWKNALNADFKATFTSQEFIGFYIDSNDSISESFSTDTTKSQLDTTLNGLQETGREIAFLLGSQGGWDAQLASEAKLSDISDNIRNISQKLIGTNVVSNLISNLSENFATVAAGGRLVFPEIWADTTFSRSFDINIKLRTPDADVLSWYMNIYVPLCHLVALAAGREKDNVNGYYSPFLVRAFYKGLFNIDMGIISDLTITKGKEGSWSVDGLPTEVDVNFSIKDLYGMMNIVPGSEPKAFVSNTLMMDYVANTCGININQMDLLRSLEIYWILKVDKITDIPNKIFRGFRTTIDQLAMNFYHKVLNKYII